MKIIIPVLIFLLHILIFAPALYSQDDSIDTGTKITMSQEEWHLKRDQYATAAIILLRKLEKLDSAMEVLKKIKEENDRMSLMDCDSLLLALVSASKDDYYDFKNKLDETEKKITSKTGTPEDARKMYFDEITNSKIRCLPEFQDRYLSLKKMLEPWESSKVTAEQKTTSGTYTVVQGDNLHKISEKLFNTPIYWKQIWKANDFIRSNNLIYPDEVLIIPQINELNK